MCSRVGFGLPCLRFDVAKIALRFDVENISTLSSSNRSCGSLKM